MSPAAIAPFAGSEHLANRQIASRDWCEQCERPVLPQEAAACQSRWCGARRHASNGTR